MSTDHKDASHKKQTMISNREAILVICGLTFLPLALHQVFFNTDFYLKNFGTTEMRFRLFQKNLDKEFLAKATFFHSVESYDIFDEAVQSAVSNSMKDPESAKFGKIVAMRRENDVYLCGVVNAKNSYGAYTGFKPFNVTVHLGTTLAKTRLGPPRFKRWLIEEECRLAFGIDKFL